MAAAAAAAVVLRRLTSRGCHLQSVSRLFSTSDSHIMQSNASAPCAPIMPSGGPTVPVIPSTALPYCCDDIISIPMIDTMYNPAEKPLSERLIPFADYAELNPIFLKITANPLIEESEEAFDVDLAWRSIFGSIIRTGHSYLKQEIVAAPSFFPGNILIDPHYMQAHLVDPIGIRFPDKRVPVYRAWTYNAISRLITDVCRLLHPGVKIPREVSGMQELMEFKYINEFIDEIIAYNPCLLDTLGYVSLMHHLDHLCRHRYFTSKIQEEMFARQKALVRAAFTKGQDDKTKWGRVVAEDSILDDRLQYICSNIPSPDYVPHSQEQMTWWGSIVLGVARSEFAHLWERDVLRKLNLACGRSLTMDHAVQHSRQRLPLLAAQTAEGLLIANKGDDLGLSGFVSAYPLVNCRK